MKKFFILLLTIILWIASGNLCLAENTGTVENSVTSLSAVIKVMSAKIGPDGGIIKVEKECPIKGLEINIPAGTGIPIKNKNPVSSIKADEIKNAADPAIVLTDPCGAKNEGHFFELILIPVTAASGSLTARTRTGR